jgi:DNA sulfur modification protein DndC
MEELKAIDTIWDLEGDLTRRKLVEIYYKVYGEKLPWDEYKEPLYDSEIVDAIKGTAEEADIPFELITKLIVSINSNKYTAKSTKMQKEFDKLINQEWIHHDAMQAGLKDED